MRTTINLREDAYELALSLARSQKRSLGEVVSDIIIGDPSVSATAPAIRIDSDGLPLITTGRPITSEQVSRLMEDDGV